MAGWLRFLWAGCVLLLAPEVSAQQALPPPVEVCWKPSDLPAGVDTFLIAKESNKWEVADPNRFWNWATNRVVYKYNPALGADSLDRLPEDIRKLARFCTKPPPKQPDPPAADPPPPPPPPPPPKPAPSKKGSGKGKGGGSGKDRGGSGKDKGGGSDKLDGPKSLPKASVPSSRKPEARADRVRKETPSSLPPSNAILSKSERALPTSEEAHLLPKAKEAKLLPPSSLDQFAMNCADAKARCKRKTGDEKGPVEERTTFEEFLKEFALFAGAVNLQLDEDLNRPDGKKHGVVGGRNADGPDLAITQAVATFLQLSPAVRGEIEAFIKKVNKSVAKQPVVVETNGLSDDAANWLASQPGSVKTLCEKGTIGPFKTMQKFTLGQERAFQTHHILEQKWFKYGPMKGDTNLVPSVILTKEEHQAISEQLRVAALKFKPKTPAQLWKMYEKAYEKYPHWLQAIKPYFGK